MAIKLDARGWKACKIKKIFQNSKDKETGWKLTGNKYPKN